MDLIPYTVLCSILLTLLFQIGILHKCFQMFKSKQLRINSTPTFILFYCYLSITSLTAIGYCVYVLSLWRPNEIPYNAQVMYLVGLIRWLLIISNPIFQFGLCLERCFIVAFPYRYLDNSKKAMCIFVFVFTFAALLINLIFNGFLWLPEEETTHCRYFSCIVSMLPQTQTIIYKIIISTLEFVIAIILFYLIKHKTISMNSKGKKKNLVILVVISTTVLFEFAPNIIDETLYSLTETHVVNVIGPYRTCLSSLNIFISATLYTYVFNRTKSNVSTVQIFATTS